ncbi:sulfonate ABC transporter ATP-binding protein [Sphingobium jiangsuense]|uniref:NitT/TauT family transport system ATP-binding protein/sulfonate transport system ATP-binding protein n=1 Tax=Sphingobium jiangsuense TaxID=870476 RepID=A0A7W6BQL4_9SPHN|nr:ABC transporter ATP-binding protein [Sphingobium jiangsuense]MBB3926064.1 NitT/TauT family transport system ATP-binding protein/sulfonate transport system ATP-binding protein [Sphingobium jiangsuense]GLT00549.1 sulfonate ABC transporter ATP-binding protein [Sphingobium jiangsuense]
MSADTRPARPGQDHPGQNHPGKERGALSIAGLNKSFVIGGRPRRVLEDINLTVRPGEFVSIVGASGCGKSTLLRLIVGLDADYAGDVRLDGQRISTTSLDRGIVFQDHRLFPWMTLEQNIELALLNTDTPKERRAQIVADHIALVNLKGFEKAYPHQLSGGMAQRAAIARALVTEPKLLLLDEPLGALDALTRVHVQNEIQRIWMTQRSTMVMVTHDVEEALYLGDRVVVMSPNPGRIRRIVEVDLPHPRDRRSPLLHRLKDEILAELTSGAGQGEEEPTNLVHLPNREER